MDVVLTCPGGAMLDVLPQLDGGAINYRDAGDGSLNAAAPPPGLKRGRIHRMAHTHLIGRSRMSLDPDWAWGMPC